jgi:hypothetical protein
VYTLEESSSSSSNEIRSLEEANSPDLVRGVRNPDNLEVTTYKHSTYLFID